MFGLSTARIPSFGLITTYHDNGFKEHSVYYLDGVKDGEEFYWNDIGDIIGKCIWKDGFKEEEYIKKSWCNGYIDTIIKNNILYLSRSNIDKFTTIKILLEDNLYSVTSWWPNGIMKEDRYEAFIKGNSHLSLGCYELEGERKTWFSDGTLRETCTYVNGKLCGKYNSWHSNGAINENSYYNQGEKVGYYIIYDKNGETIEEGERSRIKSARTH